jgi:leader peptidase (prepilin peptidase)/N-methyltransferase
VTSISALIVVTVGTFGFLIGSFLNVVAYRVPRRISLLRASRCPTCAASIKPWQNVPILSWIALRGRCANCKAAISSRYPLVEATTGFAFAGVTWWALTAPAALLGTVGEGGNVAIETLLSLSLVIIAFLYFVAISVVLTLIDLDTHRLPTSIVAPSYLVAGALFLAAAWVAGDWGSLRRAGIGMVALYALYFALKLARPGGMGGGDVKLGGLIGLYLGWVGWGALAVGAFAAFLLGGIYGIALIVIGRADRKTAIPFGPWMILGAWTGILAGPTVGRWYVHLIAGT